MEKILKFLKESEEFKKTDKYESMPLDMRDFFNQEIGRFKMVLEIQNLSEKGSSLMLKQGGVSFLKN
jgi:uncharacterized Zn ribbon protein